MSLFVCRALLCSLFKTRTPRNTAEECVAIAGKTLIEAPFVTIDIVGLSYGAMSFVYTIQEKLGCNMSGWSGAEVGFMYFGVQVFLNSPFISLASVLALRAKRGAPIEIVSFSAKK